MEDGRPSTSSQGKQMEVDESDATRQRDGRAKKVLYNDVSRMEQNVESSSGQNQPNVGTQTVVSQNGNFLKTKTQESNTEVSQEPNSELGVQAWKHNVASVGNSSTTKLGESSNRSRHCQKSRGISQTFDRREPEVTTIEDTDDDESLIGVGSNVNPGNGTQAAQPRGSSDNLSSNGSNNGSVFERQRLLDQHMEQMRTLLDERMNIFFTDFKYSYNYNHNCCYPCISPNRPIFCWGNFYCPPYYLGYYKWVPLYPLSSALEAPNPIYLHKRSVEVSSQTSRSRSTSTHNIPCSPGSQIRNTSNQNKRSTLKNNLPPAPIVEESIREDTRSQQVSPAVPSTSSQAWERSQARTKCQDAGKKKDTEKGGGSLKRQIDTEVDNRKKKTKIELVILESDEEESVEVETQNQDSENKEKRNEIYNLGCKNEENKDIANKSQKVGVPEDENREHELEIEDVVVTVDEEEKSENKGNKSSPGAEDIGNKETGNENQQFGVAIGETEVVIIGELIDITSEESEIENEDEDTEGDYEISGFADFEDENNDDYEDDEMENENDDKEYQENLGSGDGEVETDKSQASGEIDFAKNNELLKKARDSKIMNSLSLEEHYAGNVGVENIEMFINMTTTDLESRKDNILNTGTGYTTKDTKSPHQDIRFLQTENKNLEEWAVNGQNSFEKL